jgi:hypothetical protein
MKKLTSFSDVEYTINNKIDIVDSRGYKIPFVRFLNLSLIALITAMQTREYSYHIEQ